MHSDLWHARRHEHARAARGGDDDGVLEYLLKRAGRKSYIYIYIYTYSYIYTYIYIFTFRVRFNPKTVKGALQLLIDRDG